MVPRAVLARFGARCCLSLRCGQPLSEPHQNPGIQGALTGVGKPMAQAPPWTPGTWRGALGAGHTGGTDSRTGPRALEPKDCTARGPWKSIASPAGQAAQRARGARPPIGWPLQDSFYGRLGHRASLGPDSPLMSSAGIHHFVWRCGRINL